jgi:hypothetical protein
MPAAEIPLLLDIIDQAFDKKSWHGTNLRGSIRQVTAAEAAWRPADGRHCIWEIVLHAAYWKYAVRRRLSGEKRGSFPLKGSNWFTPADTSEAAWKDAVELLVDSHKSLRRVVAELDPRELRKTPPGSKETNLYVITGIAAHDVYHAGQIQILKRLRG